MDVFTIAIWVGTAVFLAFSLIKNRVRTRHALKMAFGMSKRVKS